MKSLSALNVFRASFDPSLGADERRKARIAVAVLVVVLVGGLGVASAILRSGQQQVGSAAIAEGSREMRVLGAAVGAGKPCGEQTWPYIESRCLTQAKPDETERTTPKHGLASANVALPSPTPDKPVTAIDAARSSEGTTGSAPSAEPVGEDVRTVDMARPAARQVEHALKPEFDEPMRYGRHDRFSEERPLSRREWRQLRREQLREMRRLDREARQQSRDAARTARDERLVRRWMQ